MDRPKILFVEFGLGPKIFGPKTRLEVVGKRERYEGDSVENSHLLLLLLFI